MSDDTTGYDPDQDPDTDPEQLNPRTGDAAAGGSADAPGADTDADPATLNPRTPSSDGEDST
ncbi:hypothetical protein [Cellulomonas phragmiteti]|uniref:Uncharacterized protein n=1 Tax=Cellulomonas phragmiteti TaxID=478780 RepID=A0ABQ4DQK9_9CELL|nr:hypothetical protein [Cellulomonas phragmiteti]GIG41655.1 hypothetical protein Cph01nite_34170 [Cellulomonas phragmiteti]